MTICMSNHCTNCLSTDDDGRVLADYEGSDIQTTEAPSTSRRKRSTAVNETVASDFGHTNRTVPYFDLYVMLLRCRSFNGDKWVADYCKVSIYRKLSHFTPRGTLDSAWPKVKIVWSTTRW